MISQLPIQSSGQSSGFGKVGTADEIAGFSLFNGPVTETERLPMPGKRGYFPSGLCPVTYAADKTGESRNGIVSGTMLEIILLPLAQRGDLFQFP